jgi:hypothetical protein
MLRFRYGCSKTAVVINVDESRTVLGDGIFSLRSFIVRSGGRRTRGRFARNRYENVTIIRTSGSVFLYIENSALIGEIKSQVSFVIEKDYRYRHGEFQERLRRFSKWNTRVFAAPVNSEIPEHGNYATATFTGSLVQRAENNAQQ